MINKEVEHLKPHIIRLLSQALQEQHIQALQKNFSNIFN